MMAEVIEGDCLHVMPLLGMQTFDTIIPFDLLWAAYRHLLKQNGIVALTSSQPFTSILLTSNIDNFRCEWIWKKNAGSNFATTKYFPMKEHESILIFGNKNGTYNPQMQERSANGKAMIRSKIKSKASNGDDVYSGANKGYDNSKQNQDLRVPSSVQYFNRERGLHPTQKPVALMEYLIRTYSNEGDLILDNTCGSGSTGVACVNTKRNFIGIEKESNYVEIARQRIIEAQQ